MKTEVDKLIEKKWVPAFEVYTLFRKHPDAREEVKVVAARYINPENKVIPIVDFKFPDAQVGQRTHVTLYREHDDPIIVCTDNWDRFEFEVRAA